MKGIIFSVFTFVAVLCLAPAINVATPPAKNLNIVKTEDMLLQEMETDNIEIRVSSALTLGELRSEKAVIPLMRILKNDDDERARISAAISLWKIGDGRGLYAIKRAVQFDESARVRRICKLLYMDSLKPEAEKYKQEIG